MYPHYMNIHRPTAMLIYQSPVFSHSTERGLLEIMALSEMEYSGVFQTDDA